MNDQGGDCDETESEYALPIEPVIPSIQCEINGDATHAPDDSCFPYVTELYELPPCVEGHIASDQASRQPPSER